MTEPAPIASGNEGDAGARAGVLTGRESVADRRRGDRRNNVTPWIGVERRRSQRRKNPEAVRSQFPPLRAEPILRRGGAERRGYPRTRVDASVRVFHLPRDGSAAVRLSGRLLSLSLNGALVHCAGVALVTGEHMQIDLPGAKGAHIAVAGRIVRAVKRDGDVEAAIQFENLSSDCRVRLAFILSLLYPRGSS